MLSLTSADISALVADLCDMSISYPLPILSYNSELVDRDITIEIGF